MNKCFDPITNKLKCPPHVILPIRNLAPNNINKSKAMRRAMKIRHKKLCRSCPPNTNLQRFQNDFNSSTRTGTNSRDTFTNNTFTDSGNFCPYGPFWTYWINKS